jgi:putative acetyltransferase
LVSHRTQHPPGAPGPDAAPAGGGEVVAPGEEVRPAVFPDDLEIARALFREYERSIDASRCFEGFERELAELDVRYAPPEGRLLLAFERGEPVGCAALRRLDAARSEACRLFVRSSARGSGLGGALVLRLLEEARAAGHASVLLETLPEKMGVAVALYRALGFREVPPYVAQPVPGAIYMELPLR